MKKCKKCGAELIKKRCPNGCKQNNLKVGCATVAIVFVLIITVILIAALGDTGNTTNSPNVNQAEIYETKKELIVFEGVRAEFVKLYDPKTGVTALAMSLNLENNGTEEVTVTLADGYVNDTKVQFMTGLPVTIAPNKKAVGVYMFGYDGLGFSKVEEIEKVEFKLSLLNENWTGVKQSESVVIDFKD
ncbi:MAG: hypothetical protein J6S00_05800 [Clostridia bacterium]|nr:hypothetical protein [Clostridia bacterium]